MIHLVLLDKDPDLNEIIFEKLSEKIKDLEEELASLKENKRSNTDQLKHKPQNVSKQISQIASPKFTIEHYNNLFKVRIKNLS